MLIQFNFRNFKSFKDEASFDMTATSIKEHADTLIDFEEERYLKVGAIYGANASGKSNVLEAFQAMRFLVSNSFQSVAKWEKIPLKKFAFDKSSKESDTMFEVFFETAGEVYQYGFEINEDKITEEWLYKQKKNKSKTYQLIFLRNGEFKLSKELKVYSELLNGVNEKTLLLSFLANVNIKELNDIYNWFIKTPVINFGDPFLDMMMSSSSLPAILAEGDLEEEKIFNEFLKNIDTGIKKIRLEKVNTEEKEKYRAFSIHWDNETNKEIELALEEESSGTMKMLTLYAYLRNVIKLGGTLLIDELDAKLHPLLSKYIIQLFHNESTNPKNAQLIYTTHDVVNLTKENFRRDEIWFVEKNKRNESELYSLVEYKLDNSKVRNDATYNKDYLLGRYGALPILKEFVDVEGDI